MKKFRWQLLIILVTGLIVGVLLIIQQLDPGDETQAPPSPISGGVYTEALVGNFMRLNPFLDTYNEPDQAVDQLIFNSLVYFDAKGLPQSELAESWGVAKDGTVYNFSLKPDVFWHDGEPFDTEDILYTVSILKSDHGLIPADLHNLWSEVEVVALADDQLQFLLPEPFAPFLDYLTFGILPEHILGGLGLEEMIDHPFNVAPIGTGPFKFQRLLVEDGNIVGVVLEAFEEYFWGRPYLDEFIFRYYPTSQEAYNAYLQGEVEGFGAVDLQILQDVLSDPNLTTYTTRKPILTMLYLNLENPEVGFFQNPDFRRALMASINRNRILEQVYQGQAIPANGPIIPGTWAYYVDLENINYDFVYAEELFSATGAVLDEENDVFVTDSGLPIVTTLLHPDDTLHTQIAEFIQADWQALGIAVELNPQPYEDVLAALQARDYQTALVDINLANSPDPDPYPFWAQAQLKSGQNYAEWDNRSASEFLEQARMTVDQAERERLYRNFQVLFMREMPSLPLFYPVYTYAITDDIQGVNLGPILQPNHRFNHVHEWYILSAREGSSAQPNDEMVTPEN
jgi:peptide/nickel transport system substrate-binding protein